jgi:hypothetical protein
VTIRRKSSPLREAFGMLPKGKRGFDTEKLLKEVREELGSKW